jgi:hypothetical protein
MAPILAWKLLSNSCANLIESLKKIAKSNDFISRHKLSTKAFVRKRLLTFPTMIFFLINLLKGSIQDELDHFFKVIKGLDICQHVVTKSAFTQARKNLNPSAFVELNYHFNRTFYNTFPANTWMGFNLMATDGSTFQLPKIEEIMDHFGVWHTAAGTDCPMARTTQLYDVLNKITVSAVIAPKSNGERDLATEVFLNLRSLDIVLLDRGYPAFWLFKLILTAGGHFCARISDKSWKEVKKFRQSGKWDQHLTFNATWTSKKKCRELGLDLEPLKLRLVRVALKTGETEILITALMDQDSYPTECFDDLYHHRWPVEEDYKLMKHRIEMENFTGKSVLSVYQDFHAKVFAKNLAGVLAHPTQEVIDRDTADRKYNLN